MLINENRTESYVGTVNLSDPEDQAWIRTVRSSISDVNAIRKSNGDSHRQYVKLHGRGHRMGERRYNQYLPLKFAEKADIYVYTRYR